MSQHEEQIPSQRIEQVKNSAISNAGDAFNFNAARDQYISLHAPLKSWKPPLMLPLRAQPFVGREEDLDWLLQQLHDEAGKILAICGPGGMGKTALVAEALSRLVSQENWLIRFPDGIFYHSFYTYPLLAVAFEELARVFGEEPGSNPHLAARRALSHRSALLVFDGIEAIDDAQSLRELVGGKNVVLVLSRRRSDAPDLAHRRDLGVLPQEQAITLLQQLAGPRGADRQSVERLVQQISGYPLALQLIGNYLSSRQEEVADYLQWFEEEGLATLNFGKHQDQSVPMLLQRTYDSLTPSEQHVFVVLGLLAPAPFPLELVQGILAIPERIVREALGVLVNLSVLRRPDVGYEVSHSLIHTFAREYLSSRVNATSFPSTDTITTWREQLLTTLAAHFDRSNLYDRVTLALWQPHVQPLLATDYLTAQQCLTATRLFNVVGFEALTQGKYEQAEPLYLRALQITEQQLGPLHLDTARSLNRLAGLYKAQGKYEQAEPLYLRALQIIKQQLEPLHPETAAGLNNLADLYRTQGKYEQAEPLYLRALQITEQQLEPLHPETAANLNNLALLYYHQGKYEQAEPLYQRALAIWERQLGPLHPDTAKGLNNLAYLYKAQGKYEQAEPLYQRALAIWERQLGPLHPDTAKGLNNLADLYRTQGKYEQAEPLLVRALQIREQQLGPLHPDTATSLNDLALLYYYQGKYEQAEPLLVRALQIREQQLGPLHPNTATSLNNLAALYSAQEKYTEAEPLYLRALQITEQQLGPLHPDTANSLNNLAALYRAQGKYEQAEPLLARALQISEQQLGMDHPQTQRVRSNYLMLLMLLSEARTGWDWDPEALSQWLAQREPDDDCT